MTLIYLDECFLRLRFSHLCGRHLFTFLFRLDFRSFCFTYFIYLVSFVLTSSELRWKHLFMRVVENHGCKCNCRNFLDNFTYKHLHVDCSGTIVYTWIINTNFSACSHKIAWKRCGAQRKWNGIVNQTKNWPIELNIEFKKTTLHHPPNTF